jgi:hypothetical protein
MKNKQKQSQNVVVNIHNPVRRKPKEPERNSNVYVPQHRGFIYDVNNPVQNHHQMPQPSLNRGQEPKKEAELTKPREEVKIEIAPHRPHMNSEAIHVHIPVGERELTARSTFIPIKRDQGTQEYRRPVAFDIPAHEQVNKPSPPSTFQHSVRNRFGPMRREMGNLQGEGYFRVEAASPTNLPQTLHEPLMTRAQSRQRDREAHDAEAARHRADREIRDRTVAPQEVRAPLGGRVRGRPPK